MFMTLAPRALPSTEALQSHVGGRVMLTFAEEILLLRLDDEGEFLRINEGAMECVLVRAVLMDLSFCPSG